MTLPSDPEALANYYMGIGASIAFMSIHDMIQELEVFYLDEMWPTSSPEYSAVGIILQNLRTVLIKKQNSVANYANDLLE